MRTIRLVTIAALALAGFSSQASARDPGRPLDAAGLRDVPTAYASLRRSERRAERSQKAAYRAALKAGYKPLSDLTGGAYPSFTPGIGAVYTKREFLPNGPFIAFDHKGRQVSTIYKVSLEKLTTKGTFDAGGIEMPPVDHVGGHFSGSHPGVDFPHYSFVFWHVPKKDQSSVAE